MSDQHLNGNGPAHAGEATELARSWSQDPRWRGIAREYTAEQVVKLRGSVRIEHSLARLGA